MNPSRPGRTFRLPPSLFAAIAVAVICCAALAQQSGAPATAPTTAAALDASAQTQIQERTLFELFKAELRFALVGDFEMGVFFEAGNLWYSSKTWKPFDLRPVAGTGVRYVTPVGPLALDVGFNLAPDDRLNEPIFAIQFSVGLF